MTNKCLSSKMTKFLLYDDELRKNKTITITVRQYDNGEYALYANFKGSKAILLSGPKSQKPSRRITDFKIKENQLFKLLSQLKKDHCWSSILDKKYDLSK